MLLKQKLVSFAGLSMFIILLSTSVIVQAVPLCYMINEAGQTVDLSYMCNRSSIRTEPEKNQQEGRIFSRRIPVNNVTDQEFIRTHTDVHRYLSREESQEDSWNNFQYYNRFLEFPSRNVSRTVTRQEISPRVIRYSREVLINPDGSEVVINNSNSSRISRHRVIGSSGFPESVFVDYSQVPSASLESSYRSTPRTQVRGTITY